MHSSQFFHRPICLWSTGPRHLFFPLVKYRPYHHWFPLQYSQLCLITILQPMKMQIQCLAFNFQELQLLLRTKIKKHHLLLVIMLTKLSRENLQMICWRRNQSVSYFPKISLKESQVWPMIMSTQLGTKWFRWKCLLLKLRLWWV